MTYIVFHESERSVHSLIVTADKKEANRVATAEAHSMTKAQRKTDVVTVYGYDVDINDPRVNDLANGINLPDVEVKHWAEIY